MTAFDKDMSDPRRDEVIAGEYVLGALSAEDRRRVERRLARDRRFAAVVSRWERNLADFDEDHPAYPAVARRLRVTATPCDVRFAGTVSGGLWNSLVFWRALALALLAVVVALAVTARLPVPDTAAPAPASGSVRVD
ncbi:hypothetical protein [Shinella pollutisoli]|uniref:Anti-sigma factor n=1 Tax=Shinella pollutisoli TaxID=2250594 RepID=A0ABV7DA66_9HYPH|nr:hypothetical protein [Shinella pollutisoli]